MDQYLALGPPIPPKAAFFGGLPGMAKSLIFQDFTFRWALREGRVVPAGKAPICPTRVPRSPGRARADGVAEGESLGGC